MGVSTACPPTERLGNLLHGDLPALDETAVAEHLSDCAVCQRRLEEQAAGGDFDPELVRQLTSDDRPNRDSAYWPAMVKLTQTDPNSTVASPDSTSNDASATAFLLPAERDGSIGKFAEFDVLRIVGRGGMGIVFEAIDPCLDRHVAVKVLDPKLAKDEVARQRFLREARAAAAVTHENVVIIHAVNEHSVDDVTDLPYLVMQYVAGESLQERIDRDPPTISEAVAIGRQVATGLAAAHARGLIHRDVKPANVLLSQDECLHCEEEVSSRTLSSMYHVKLTDFGLARAAEDVKLTQTGFVPGTPQYMAPEQARGEPLDHRSDLFSLGGLLYALVTGRVPFQGSTPYLVLRQVTEEMPAPIRSLSPEVPDWLAAIIEKLLAKQPADRFQTAAEVAGLLFEGEARLIFCPIHGVKPPSGLARVTAPVRRKLAMWPAAALVAAGLIAGIGMSVAGVIPASWHRSLAAEKATAPLATFENRDGAVYSVGFSSDGLTLAMGAEDGTVRLWNVADGSIQGTLKGHRGAVTSIAFKDDGTGMATSGEDGTVRMWSLPARQETGELKLPSPVRSVQFNRESSAFVTSSQDGEVTYWDAFTLERKASPRGHNGTANAAVVSADGTTLASGGSDKMLKIWEASNGRERLSIPVHNGPLYGLAISPDGGLVASGGWDHNVRLSDVRRGEARGTLEGHTEDVLSVAFNHDGTKVASASQDRTVKIWDVATGKELASFGGHSGVVRSVCFSPDGKTVAAGGRDGTVRIWPVP